VALGLHERSAWQTNLQLLSVVPQNAAIVESTRAMAAARPTRT
jgi:hypothetical protein